MNALATEWVEKAESDYRTAEREMRVRKEPSLVATSLACQQLVRSRARSLISSGTMVWPMLG